MRIGPIGQVSVFCAKLGHFILTLFSTKFTKQKTKRDLETNWWMSHFTYPEFFRRPALGDGAAASRGWPDFGKVCSRPEFFFKSIGILTDNNISDEIVWPEYPQHAVFQPLKF
jgi:hypothetical protein